MRDTMRLLFAAEFFWLPLICHAQSVNRSELARILNFEAGPTGGAPHGWGGGPRETIFADDKIVHGGKWAARLERDASSANTFSTITIGIPVDFTGTRIELRGFLKTEDVSDFAGLWMREDGDSGVVAFDNMQSRHVKGTHEWAEYSIALPLSSEAKQLVFGVLSAGTGKTWADDLQLLVDGKPIWDVPKVEPPKTALDLDHEFDHGSGIAVNDLSKTQIDNLATLGKIWGFLKYHHPAIVSGQHHWDYDLLRVLQQVLSATDRAAANAAVHKWIAALGAVDECTECARLSERDLYMKPELDWISDEKLLGADLSQDLRRISRNRPATGKQFYVSLRPGVENPVFEHDPAYPGIKLPDAGFQILALYRFWNIVKYWYPYRDVVGENWDDVLTEFLPRVALAKTADSYQRELMAFIALVHDTHANLWSSLAVRPPVGNCQLPVGVRFVENSAVVSGYSHGEGGPATGLKIGDVILDLDGTPVSDLVDRWSPYYAASNDPTRLRDIARSMTRGDCGPSALRVRRESQTLTLTTSRAPTGTVDQPGRSTHDLPGETFRNLSKDVGYLKLSSVKMADTARYIESAKDTKGLIIDIRNYPSEFVVFTLGSLLVDKPTEFVRFTAGDLSNPGAFHWVPPLSLIPQQPHYKGKVVILVDETSQSSAEYTAMAFRSAPGAIVVGSTTAGADGNVSAIPLPGGFQAMISGIGVFYPNKKPTQRIGIIPNIEIKPTVAGIRAGRDEVLEEALRQILGPDTPAVQIEALAKP
ncbi:MAG: S41 family peptidase [Bryobacteraceae bacterium]|jgi:C-terminal processing protease CtpA/Prc